MARGTSLGIPLNSQFKGGESDTVREIPPEWRAALDLLIVETPVPYDTDVIDLTSGVLAIKREQKFTSESTLRKTSTDTELPAVLLEKYTDKYKQVGTRTRKFHYIDDFGTINVPSATISVNTKNFGNKHFEEIIEDDGTLFVHSLFEEELTDPVPARFKPLFEISTVESSSIGIAIDPTLVFGDLKKTEEQTDAFVKRERHTFHNLTTLPKILTGLKLTPEAQIETLTETLDTTAGAPTIDADYIDFEVEQLAPNLFTTKVGTVPNVFPHNVFTTELQLLWQLPPEFRAALPETSHRFDEAGVAVAPSLSGDEIFASEEQLTEFRRRVETKSRDLSVLPLTLTSYKVTKDKQIETVSSTLDTGLQSLSGLIDELTIEGDVVNLGHNLSILKLGTVASLFAAKVASTEVPDLVPESFRPFIPTHDEEVTVAGTVVDPPVLSIGDLLKKETQLDDFTKRVMTRGRVGIILPITHFNVETTEEFGGGIAHRIVTLDTTGSLTVNSGLTVIKSSVVDNGNGTEVRETLQLVAGSWPTLVDDRFDKEMQVRITEEDQVVAPSYTPVDTTYSTERLKGIDWVRARRTKLSKTPTAISKATAIVEEVDGPFQFPGLIYAVTGGYYRRQASAQLCQHILRTWWLSSVTKPTRGLPGSGMDVEVQDIVMDDIIISELNNTAALAYSGMCLHDAITTFGTFVYAATVPSATAYIAMIGNEIVVAASIETTDIPFLWKIQTKSVTAQ